MSEIKVEIPIPLRNYVDLIIRKRSPYYDIIKYLIQEMEIHFLKNEMPEIVYTINPRVLQEELEKMIKNEKITRVNVCRSVLALLYGSKLREQEDFYVTTTSGGRKNYHVKVNPATLSRLKLFLY